MVLTCSQPATVRPGTCRLVRDGPVAGYPGTGIPPEAASASGNRFFAERQDGAGGGALAASGHFFAFMVLSWRFPARVRRHVLTDLPVNSVFPAFGNPVLI
jgi:hypothetical protein